MVFYRLWVCVVRVAAVQRLLGIQLSLSLWFVFVLVCHSFTSAVLISFSYLLSRGATAVNALTLSLFRRIWLNSACNYPCWSRCVKPGGKLHSVRRRESPWTQTATAELKQRGIRAGFASLLVMELGVSENISLFNYSFTVKRFPLLYFSTFRNLTMRRCVVALRGCTNKE